MLIQQLSNQPKQLMSTNKLKNIVYNLLDSCQSSFKIYKVSIEHAKKKKNEIKTISTNLHNRHCTKSKVFSKCNQRNLQETVHLVTFTEDILNRKLHFSCIVVLERRTLQRYLLNSEMM